MWKVGNLVSYEMGKGESDYMTHEYLITAIDYTTAMTYKWSNWKLQKNRVMKVQRSCKRYFWYKRKFYHFYCGILPIHLLLRNILQVFLCCVLFFKKWSVETLVNTACCEISLICIFGQFWHSQWYYIQHISTLRESVIKDIVNL